MAPTIGKSSKFKFKYQERDPEEVKRRATQTGSGRDTYIDGNIKTWTPKAGDHKVRILPPTWEDAPHYGLEIFVHGGIGPDNANYLCLAKMQNEACPLCEARAEADSDEELQKALRASKRVAVYVIDRKNEGDGPKIWAMPWGFDKEICAQAVDDDSGETLAVDHPDEGYDLSFTVEGEGVRKRYGGAKFSRKKTPISDDDDMAVEWLKFISDHPVPDTLNFFDYAHIQAAYEGKSSKVDKDEKASKKDKKADAPDDDSNLPDKKEPKKSGRPAISKKKEPEPEEAAKLSWDEVHEMDADALGDLSTEHGVDFGDTQFDSLEACQDWLCEQLEITQEEEVEKEEKPKVGGGSLKDRLSKLGKKK